MPQVVLKMDGLTKFRKRTFIEDDQDFAQHIDMSAATVSRVLAGKSKPSNEFIAGTLKLFGHIWFNELFKVTD